MSNLPQIALYPLIMRVIVEYYDIVKWYLGYLFLNPIYSSASEHRCCVNDDSY